MPVAIQLSRIITIERTPESLCKVSVNGLHVAVETFEPGEVHINADIAEPITSVKTGDILSIKNSDIKCQFIKVVQHET